MSLVNLVLKSFYSIAIKMRCFNLMKLIRCDVRGVVIENVQIGRCGRARCDLPQHCRWRARSRSARPPPPSRGKHTPRPSPRARTALPSPGALHVHAMHSLFMAATTLCSFLMLFFSPQKRAPHKHFLYFMSSSRPGRAVLSFT